MLRELNIENFALIDGLHLDFERGFTVLTGETGAGKSIIIDALSAALGERIGADAIREGEQRARVEAVFDAADAPEALAALERAGLRDGDETLIILQREIADGRSLYRVNRRASTQAALREIGTHLVDIHGQHEHQTLIHEESHLGFLDAFGGPEHAVLVSAYESAYAEFAAAVKALQDLHMDERERAQRLDMLRFQVEEIEAAGLQPDEDQVLEADRLRLQHAERIREALHEACELLDGDRDEAPSALAAVQVAGQNLERVQSVAPELAPLAQDLGGAAAAVEEASRELRRYLEDLNADPERLEQIETRLAAIASLKRKYGDSVAEVLAFWDRAAAELRDLEDIETREEDLRADLERARKAAGKIGEELSTARRKLAGELGRAVETELAGLGMDAPRLEVEFERTADEDGLQTPDGARCRASKRGIDTVRFLFSANTGEPVRPLSKVVSGGELSRLMLVLKSLGIRGAQIPTIVFDEVDAGIGGRVAHAVGERIAQVASVGQALCVTHLPQIARLATHHLHVTKGVSGHRTIIRVLPLERAGRIEELARMMGGSAEDKTALKHAQELLDAGSRK